MSGKIMSAVVILLALAAISGAGAWLASRHYQPTIGRLNEALTQCKGSNKQQAATIASQNAGIEALQHKQDELETKAKAAQEKPAGRRRATIRGQTRLWQSEPQAKRARRRLLRLTQSCAGSVLNEKADRVFCLGVGRLLERAAGAVICRGESAGGCSMQGRRRSAPGFCR